MTKPTTERVEVTVTFKIDLQYGATRRGHWVQHPGAKWPDPREEFVYDELTAADMRKECIEHIRRNFTDVHDGMAIGRYGDGSSWDIVQDGRDKPKVRVAKQKGAKR